MMQERCNSIYNRIDIDSMYIPGVRYLVADGHVVIFGAENGTLAVDFKKWAKLNREVQEIIDVYGGGERMIENG